MEWKGKFYFHQILSWINCYLGLSVGPSVHQTIKQRWCQQFSICGGSKKWKNLKNRKSGKRTNWPLNSDFLSIFHSFFIFFLFETSVFFSFENSNMTSFDNLYKIIHTYFIKCFFFILSLFFQWLMRKESKTLYVIFFYVLGICCS